ncbi:hypothetical protein IW262DRAFT_1297843 [Armillaria fumosa]|nr:hypothetical protein IW262DRAFT_1297843 [Armillaria fumosa]
MSFGDQSPFSTETIVQLQARSDYIPSASDVHHIRESLRTIEKEVQRYDDELFHLYTLMTQREAEQRELKLNAEKCLSILAPIKRLPNEMLSEIFAQCCKQGDEDVNCIGDTGTLSAMSISLVCSRWRSLPISTKSLWAVFSISPTVVSTCTLQYLQMYISRSGSIPLTIQVPGHPYQYAELARASRFYDILLDAAPKWRRMDLGSVHFGKRLSPVKHHLQNLEELIVELNCLSTTDRDVFGDAPQLRTLSIAITPEAASHTFPYHQISNLTLFIRCFYSFVEFLSKFSRVRNLELGGYLDDVSSFQGLAKTDLGTVQTLYVNNASIIPFVVRAFSFPQLESLTLICQDTTHFSQFMPIYRQFLELLEQPVHGLKVLVLEEIAIEDQEMIAVLRLTPNLTELSIQCCDGIPAGAFERSKTLTEGFVRSLTFSPPVIQWHSPPVASLLPNLTSLDLALNSSFGLHDALVDMLTSRWRPPALVSVHGHVSCLNTVTLRNIVKPEHATTVNQLKLWDYVERVEDCVPQKVGDYVHGGNLLGEGPAKDGRVCTLVEGRNSGLDLGLANVFWAPLTSGVSCTALYCLSNSASSSAVGRFLEEQNRHNRQRSEWPHIAAHQNIQKHEQQQKNTLQQSFDIGRKNVGEEKEDCNEDFLLQAERVVVEGCKVL